MSAIAGIVHRDGRPASVAAVDGLLDEMAHRGPDGRGAWADGPVALGHGLLSALPGADVQPVCAAAAGLCLVADARIDNRDELGAGDLPDAEAILHAYRVWGAGCVDRLVGDFAFALWDGQARRLLCARDPIGVKPFFYAVDGPTLRFASEPAAVAGADPRPNLALMARYLLNRFDEPIETLYEGVLRLAPGHLLVVEAGGIDTRRYWTPVPRPVVRYPTDADYAEHFGAVFTQAVAARLRAAGPVGAHLSGGLDSSSIVAVARTVAPLRTYSMVFPGLPCDERHYIDDVVAGGGVSPTYLPHAEHLAALDFEETRRFPDVFYGPTLYALTPALEQARAAGVRVMLGGIGGDDVLSVGFNRWLGLLRRGKVAEVSRQVDRYASATGATRRSLVFRHLVAPMVPGLIKAGLRPLRGRSSPAVPDWLDAGTVASLGATDPEPPAGAGDGFAAPAQGEVYRRLAGGRTVSFALDAADRHAAAFGIEYRYPFFDRRLVEFVLSLPLDQWSRDGQSKLLLRRAMAGLLPESVRARNDKAEFSAVVNHELRERQAAKVTQLLATSRLADLGLVDRRRVEALYADYGQGTAGARRAIETVVGLELWHRAAIEHDQETGGRR